MSHNVDSYKFSIIGIETTSLCNSKCRVCPREEHYSRPVIDMDLDLFKKIKCFSEAPESNLKSFAPTTKFIALFSC